MKFVISRIMKATVSMAVAFIACSEVAFAIPASPFPMNVRQPDGSMIEVRVHGDEHHYVVTTADCSRVLRRNAAGSYVASEVFDRAVFNRQLASVKRHLSAMPLASGGDGFPTHGKQKALAILVEYPETDEHPQGRRFTIDNPRQYFEDMLNQEGFSADGATGSVRDYFLDASNGIFDLEFDVYGPVTLENDLSYYVKQTNGENLDAWRMVEEACRVLDSQIDFSDYDRDQDGIIDNIYVFYAGEGGATSATPDECIWQHAADIERITGKQFIFDGRRLNHYACSNEYRMVRDVSGNMVRMNEGIGTVCHEFSHVLGLPDFYDTSGMGVYTPGDWALMDVGCHLNNSRTPPHFTALERMLLGWLDPVTIEQKPQTLSLRDISCNEAYRINTPNDNEYFLLENRQQNGWDAYIPGHGMLIWHVKYSKDFWDANQVNTRSNDMGITIVRADGLANDATKDGDVFPGVAKVTALNDDGYPNMLTNDGKRTETPLSRITEAGGIISFDVCKTVSQLGKVTGLEAKDIVPTGFTATWNSVVNAAGYVLNVYTRTAAGQIVPVDRYNDLSVSSTSVAVTGLEAATKYYFTVRAVSGAVSGAVSDEYEVETPSMTFEYTTPDGVEIVSKTNSSFVVSWNELEDAVDYSMNVFTKKPGVPESTELDFSDGVETLPGGWVTNSNFTISMKGYYGNASPSLSLPDDYGRLQSPLLPNVLVGLEFWYRERSGSGTNYIEVSVLNGSQWDLVDRIDLPQRMSEGVTYVLAADKIPANAAAVRIIYRKGDKGSLAIDDVKAKYAGQSMDVPLNGWEDKLLGSAETQAVVDGLQAGIDYYFTVRGVDASGIRSQASEEVKVSIGNGGIAEVVEDMPDVHVDAAGNVTVTGIDACDINIFDLQGRPVGMQLPGHGVYILRAGCKAVKIIY